ncbi:MAG: hypothetical protein WAL56_23220 [Candidatus Sulfotelmatobacter sp.]
MQRTSRTTRIPFQLSSTLYKNLNAYALGATAAGVALLAIVPAATAEIVYTPADHEIKPNRGGTGFFLDLNHDGINDFLIVNFYSTTSALLNVGVSPEQPGNEIFSNGAGYAAAIPAGIAIGSNGRFHPAQSLNMANDDFPVGNCQGPWKEARNKYLGLKFKINGEIHFGWARLSVTCFTPAAARVLLTGYAYETVANQPIVTGQTSGTAELSTIAPSATSHPAQLGVLAVGSRGLFLWRRDD